MPMTCVVDAIKEGRYENKIALGERWSARSTQRRRYHEEEARLTLLFRNDLEKEHSMIGHPKAKTLFEMAWSDQRSDGLRAVAWRYEDLLQLVKP